MTADGAYRLHLVGRAGNAGSLCIGLRSASRPYPVPADCVVSTASGAVIAQDNDSGPGVDALIVMSRAAGTYTIEATTAVPAQMGNYVLTTGP